MRRSTSTVRRACAVGTTIALVGLTTGLGIMTATAASAAPADEVSSSQTATATSGDQAASSGQGTGTQASDGDQAALGTDATAGSGDDTATGTTPDGSTETSIGTDTPGTTPDSATDTDTDTGSAGTATTPGSTGSTTPASGTPAADATPTDAPTGAPQDAPAVTITGDARVGSTLEAKPTGYDEDGAFSFVWTIDGEPGTAPLAKVDSLTLDDALVGRKVTVSVTGTPADGSPVRTTSATTGAITQDPVFVDESGRPITEGADVDDPQYLDATAGEQFSYTFHAEGFPAPTYQLDWYWDDEEGDDTVVSTKAQQQATASAQQNALGTIGVGVQEDEGDDDDLGPDVQLPDGFTFDPRTGVLSGSTELASYYDFAVTATSGDVTAKQYVELTVNPGVPAGFAVTTADQATLETQQPVLWIISPEGDVTTVRIDLDADDLWSAIDVQEGGRPTVQQGGTLLVSGQPVDRFGNYVENFDEDGDPIVLETVTSDVASDVVERIDAEDGGGASVTFPHASIHTLTVSAPTMQGTSFAVEVVPTVAPALTPTTPVAAAPVSRPAVGSLAYTGADESAPIAWTLGLLVAGAGLLGARALRRRRAER